MNLIVGTYSKDTNSEGIYIFDLNENGKLENKRVIKNKNNPSWLSILKEEGLIVAIEELDDVVSFSTYGINTKKEKQSLILKENGFGSCHSIVDNNKLLVSNYGSGNFLIFEKNEDEFHLSSKQYKYNSSNKARCHEIVVSEKYIIAIDLGLDLFIVYDKNLNEIKTVKLEEKDGPRHGVFSKDEKYFYLVTELSNKLYTYDENFNEVDKLSTLDKDFNQTSYASEIKLSKDGKTLYISNRGEETIAIFNLKENKPEYKTKINAQGQHPRSFTLKDNLLIIANKDTDNIVVIDLETKTKVEEVNIISPTFVEIY